MTSTQIRQSFLDFFKSRSHTIVPSASLMPDSPNLLFTNAGMNQFVPIFLGQTQCPYIPGRAADTQKCIRAGGKHNDLDDVGLDTYHHTFFEMLGNWSFGDYFKLEAIEWAWELVVMAWGFPPARLYATVFCPYLGEPGWEAKWKTELEQILVLTMTSPEFISPDPNASPFEVADQEAAMYWAKKFQTAGLDPRVHIVPGNKKDNFWMMGETGPCGPCSELHVDLTPAGDTKGALVNQGDARCIEIWNLVFIQFNSNPDGTFAPLPAQHVDTGMGFERVTSIIQGTKGLKDFANAKISNYETDIFRPIFDALEKLSGKKYGSTLPGGAHAPSRVPDRAPAVRTDARQRASESRAEARSGAVDEASTAAREARALPEHGNTLAAHGHTGQEKIDIAFRVIADHIRTLSFAIADGIQPGNTDRNYVLRRILRRAVRYGRTLGFHEPFFYKLVDVLADTMGDVFPEIRAKKQHVQDVIRIEEEAFNKTLDSGLDVFEKIIALIAYLQISAKSLQEVAHSYEQTRQRIGKTLEKAKAVLVEKKARAEAKRIRELVAAGDFDLLDRTTTKDESELPRYANRFAEAIESATADEAADSVSDEFIRDLPLHLDALLRGTKAVEDNKGRIHGAAAFLLYDTYGFPLDLTELMARERGLSVDKEGFEKLMEEQRARARAAQKKEVISLSQIETTTPTKFVGFDKLETPAKVLEVVSLKDKTAVILDTSACYAEMGGQVGDTGEISGGGKLWRISNTQKSGNTWLHFIEAEPAADVSRGAHAPSRVPDRAPAVGTDARQRASEPRAEARSGAVDAAPPAARGARALPAHEISGTTAPKYSRRNLPHFERPWAKYMVTFSTRERRKLTSPERDLVLKSVLYAHEHRQYQLYAACVMPDHVHLLFEPQIKGEDKDGKTVFWPLSEILQGIKSASAHNINKAFGQTGHVWEQESVDRMIRGQSDLEERFHYICRNPWDSSVVEVSENYPWLWTSDASETRAMARVGAADEASAATAEAAVLPVPGDVVTLSVDPLRRRAIERHHTVTHLLHWALHEVVSQEASQKGSFVGPDKLTFDFNSAPLTPVQIADIEKLVNERILENARVSWTEVPYADVKSRKDVMQFFGDKYGDTVRVVQIGGVAGKLDGYSMELCGGTHTRATGEIGLFRIVGENAIAAGVRRIEAIAGFTAFDAMKLDRELIKAVAGKVSSPIHELEKKIEAILAHQKELEKQVKLALLRNASNAASELLAHAATVNGIPLITHNLGDADGEFLQAIADALKGRFKGVVVLGGGSKEAVTLIATVSPDFNAKAQAGKIIQQIAPIVGGKGGGKPDNARGGGKDASKLDEALAKVKGLLG